MNPMKLVFRERGVPERANQESVQKNRRGLKSQPWHWLMLVIYILWALVFSRTKQRQSSFHLGALVNNNNNNIRLCIWSHQHSALRLYIDISVSDLQLSWLFPFKIWTCLILRVILRHGIGQAKTKEKQMLTVVLWEFEEFCRISFVIWTWEAITSSEVTFAFTQVVWVSFSLWPTGQCCELTSWP